VRIKSRSDGSFEMPIGIPAVVLGYSQLLGVDAAPATGYEPSFDLRLKPRVEIRGRVVGPDGAPREGVRITQTFVLKFADKLVYATSPVDEGRVEKRGTNVYVVPCFCMGGITTSDADGRFLLFGLPACNGKVLLQLGASDSVWVDPAGAADLVQGDDPGPLLRLPDGKSVSELPIAPRDPEVREEPLPPKTDPRDLRRDWIAKLRKEATADCGGHPPTRRGTRTDLIPEFVAALNDPDPEVRVQAVCALAYLNAPETLKPLVTALDHADEPVRAYAVMGLSWLGRARESRAPAVAALRRVADDGDPSVSIPLAAAASLVDLEEPQDPAIFFEGLRRRKGGDPPLAAEALARLMRRDAVELMIACMETSEHRHLLGRSLETLTGAKHGESVARWKSWFESNRQTLPAQAPLEDRLPDARAYFMRALGRSKRQDLRGALEDLDAAVALDERRPQLFALRASVRQSLGDLEGALRDADLAVQLDPGQSIPLSIRASVREQRGDRVGAAEDLEKAIRLLPPDAKGLSELQERLKKLR